MLPRHLVLVFVAALISNMLGCRFGYAIAHRQLYVVVILGSLLPMMQAINSAFFISAQSKKERVQIAATNGIATAVAGTVVTLFLTE
jgi:hypothetical protein